MEGLVAKLAPQSAADSASARARLYQRYADFHHALLRKATLEADDAARVEQALAILQDREAELAPGLRQALEERKSGWDTVVDLQPGAPLDRVFAAGAAVRDRDRFLRNIANGMPQNGLRICTSTASPGKVELEATFDESWRQAAELGLVLNATPADAEDLVPAASDGGYLFRLRAPPMEAADASGEAASFATTLVGVGELVLEILRGRTRLARQTVKASQLTSGPLRLFAARHANRLSMQVNDLPPLVFEDVFPLSRARPGVFALVWPPAVGMLQLHGRRQALPSAASRLERGDEAYGRGELAEALKAYREEAIVSVGTSGAQEARYKEAMCLAALKRPEAQQQLAWPPKREIAGPSWPLANFG
jgi:hypothetical protein